MANGPIVSVRGEAVLEADPEVAVFSATVHANAYKREDAVNELSTRVKQLQAVLDAHADAIEKRETSSLSIYPEFDDRGKVRRYSGNWSATVTVADFAALSDLVLAASSVEEASVHGPWWQLRTTSDLYRQARIAAVADAVRRAREYSAAFGAQLTGLVQLADQGLTSQGSGWQDKAVPMRRMAGFATGSAPELAGFDLEPARQQVVGQVEAVFTISEPDLHSMPG